MTIDYENIAPFLTQSDEELKALVRKIAGKVQDNATDVDAAEKLLLVAQMVSGILDGRRSARIYWDSYALAEKAEIETLNMNQDEQLATIKKLYQIINLMKELPTCKESERILKDLQTLQLNYRTLQLGEDE